MSDSLQGKKVLLAEDNHVNALVITRYLKKWGMEVDLATDGSICVDKALTNKYDLILMDMQMPEMDGVDATRQIRNHTDENVRNIPIVALTANSGEDIELEIREAGMNGILPKPFEPEEVRVKLAKLLS